MEIGVEAGMPKKIKSQCCGHLSDQSLRRRGQQQNPPLHSSHVPEPSPRRTQNHLPRKATHPNQSSIPNPKPKPKPEEITNIVDDLVSDFLEEDVRARHLASPRMRTISRLTSILTASRFLCPPLL
ncbi:hypothetical protein LguiA_035751 [Lonicera macranthoides]